MTQKLWALAGLTLALAAAEPVTAQEWTNPYWMSPVDPELASRLYPDFAALIQTPGRATIRCWMETDGHPYSCDVVHESPNGLGFGSAARVAVASAQVRIGRLDGRPVPTTVQTTMRFLIPEREGWNGPEPSNAQLSLARQILDSMPAFSPRDHREAMMDGLDFDRRAVVAPWIDELFPADRDADIQVAALQMARLYGENELQRILDGGPMAVRSPEEMQAARPDLTPEEQAAVAELRRRYCDRYACEAVAPPSAAE